MVLIAPEEGIKDKFEIKKMGTNMQQCISKQGRNERNIIDSLVPTPIDHCVRNHKLFSEVSQMNFLF